MSIFLLLVLQLCVPVNEHWNLSSNETLCHINCIYNTQAIQNEKVDVAFAVVAVVVVVVVVVVAAAVDFVDAVDCFVGYRHV